MSDTSGPELRIGDSEREAAVAALGDHYAAGRLTKEEYDERAARAWEARTRSALWPLFSDLPRPAPERSAPDTSSSAGPGWRPGASYRPYPRRPFGAGLLPVLVIVALIALFTHFWLLPLVLLVLFVVKMSHYRGHADGRYHGWRRP